MNMLEKAARAAALAELDDETRAVVDETTWPVFDSHYDIARAVLVAIREPDEDTANRASDIAYEGGNVVSGETCPVMQNHIRSYVDAILEGESK